jgi:cytochrome c oxidase assembly protein subunit 20
MADDTRQPLTDDGVPITKEALTANPENKPFAGSQWDDVTKKPSQPQNANLLAGGTQNTAGGKIPEVTLTNAFPKLSDFNELPRKPCVRDAYMSGISTGFMVGGMRWVFRSSIWSACSWAVASTCMVSGVMYQWCLYRRQMEKEGMMKAVEILNKNQMEKKAREEARERQKEERRKLKDQELEGTYAKLRESQAGSKPWWKVW